MPSPILAALEAEVAEATTVMASAVTLINGFSARVQAAVDAALANGATEAELAPVQAEIDALNAAGEALAAAVVANT
jgi:hypothetical protein